METKIREIWVKDGDKNTIFFHIYALYRRKKNAIMALQDFQGHWLFDRQHIREEIVRHFRGTFTSANIQNFTAIDQLFPNLITDDDNSNICKLADEKEIKNANA